MKKSSKAKYFKENLYHTPFKVVLYFQYFYWIKYVNSCPGMFLFWWCMYSNFLSLPMFSCHSTVSLWCQSEGCIFTDVLTTNWQGGKNSADNLPLFLLSMTLHYLTTGMLLWDLQLMPKRHTKLYISMLAV